MNSRYWRKKVRTFFPKSFEVTFQKIARVFDIAKASPFSKNRKGVIAMIHVGRCGSTVLGNMLDQHSEIFWDGEIYHTKWKFNNFEFKDFDSEKYLMNQMKVSGARYYGFDVKALPDQHLFLINKDLNEYIEELIKCGVTHFIILKRENYLRRMISQYAGAKTKVRHVSEAVLKPEMVYLDPQKIVFGEFKNPKSIIDCFDEIRDMYADVNEILKDKKVLNIQYENDILYAKQGPKAAYKKVCDFLNIDMEDVHINLKVTNPFEIKEVLVNYDEIKQELIGSEYEWMLEQKH